MTKYIWHCSVWNLHKLINILLAISYQEKKNIHIPTPTSTPSHLQRLLSLINASLIIARCDEGLRGPGRNQSPEAEGSRWSDFCYQLVEAERSRWSGIFLPVYWSWKVKIARFCYQLIEADGSRWPGVCYQLNEAEGSRWTGCFYQLVEVERSRWPGVCYKFTEVEGSRWSGFVTSSLRLKGRDDQETWRE